VEEGFAFKKNALDNIRQLDGWKFLVIFCLLATVFVMIQRYSTVRPPGAIRLPWLLPNGTECKRATSF